MQKNVLATTNLNSQRYMHLLFNATCYKLLAILSYTSGGYTHFALDDFFASMSSITEFNCSTIMDCTTGGYYPIIPWP